MKDYFEAYRERLERNDNKFRGYLTELCKLGYTVFAPKGRINFICVYGMIEGEKTAITLEFREVPYRWAISRPLKPSHEHGSSQLLQEYYDEPTIEQISKILESQKGNAYFINFDTLNKRNWYLNRYDAIFK